VYHITKEACIVTDKRRDSVCSISLDKLDVNIHKCPLQFFDRLSALTFVCCVRHTLTFRYAHYLLNDIFAKVKCDKLLPVAVKRQKNRRCAMTEVKP